MSAAPSRQDVKDLLVSLLPQGSAELYELDESAYIGGTLSALAGALKDTTTDRLAQLRKEVNPATIAELIPDWEQATGIGYAPIARFGTPAQRHNGVLAALRMNGGSFSLDDIRSIVQPFFLYADPSQIDIVEADRTALRTAHTYTNSVPVTVLAGATGTSTVNVIDDPRVSTAGATAYITVTTTRLDQLSLVLTGPDGTAVAFPAGWLARNPDSVTFEGYRLFAPSFARRQISGDWTLAFRNAAASVTLDAWGLFVEGEGWIYDTAIPPSIIGEGLGSELFRFTVIADSAKLGAGYDLNGAQRAITRWQPADSQGSILLV